MHSDGKSYHVCNEHEPAVAVRFVGMILPFEDKPEHDCGESRGVSINLPLDSREPECVAECVYERTDKA